MRNEIPKELDELMWQITESADLAAADDFFSRFPSYRIELERRMNLARELRERRGVRHIPREDLVSRPRSRVIPIGLALICAVLLAYVYFKHFQSGQSRDSKQGAFSSTEVPVSPTRSNPSDSGQSLNGSLPPVGTVSPEENSRVPLGNGDVSELDNKDPYGLQRPVKSINLSNVPLSTAVQLIAAAAKVKITMAPGLKDQTISLQTGESTIGDLLNALGSEYGFKISPQGPGDFILIPIEGTN